MLASLALSLAIYLTLILCQRERGFLLLLNKEGSKTTFFLLSKYQSKFSTSPEKAGSQLSPLPLGEG
jgi:hypothetical protein